MYISKLLCFIDENKSTNSFKLDQLNYKKYLNVKILVTPLYS